MAENTVREVVIEVEVDGTPFTFAISYTGDTMPKELDKFIVEHLGERPTREER